MRGFPVEAEKIRSLTSALVMAVNVIVESNQRKAWEEYTAVEGPLWVEDGLNVQQYQGLYIEANENKTTADESLLWNRIWDYR